jgi:hypothetical protein
MTNLRRTLPAFLLLAAVGLAACTGSGGGASAAPSLEATGSPLVPESAAPSADGPVTTPEQAWAAVKASDPRFANIMPKDPDLIGQSAWYEVVPASGVGAFIVTVNVGWGDCPSGCIDQHVWTFSVAPDGTVTLQSETGDEPPPDAFPATGSDAY